MWLYTALHEAAAKGHANTCSLLLSYDANAHLKNCYGRTPLELAGEHADASWQRRIGVEAAGYGLLRAAASGDLDKVERLVGDTPETAFNSTKTSTSATTAVAELVNFKHARGLDTPLHAAAAGLPHSNRLAVCVFLIEKGARVTELNAKRQTPLHAALLGGHLDCVELLLLQMQRNAAEAIDLADANGESALHYAAKLNDLGACSLLLARGAQPGLSSNDKRLPHELCADATLRATLIGGCSFVYLIFSHQIASARIELLYDLFYLKRN
jgi:ankyrin repeat protein